MSIPDRGLRPRCLEDSEISPLWHHLCFLSRAESEKTRKWSEHGCCNGNCRFRPKRQSYRPVETGCTPPQRYSCTTIPRWAERIPVFSRPLSFLWRTISRHLSHSNRPRSHRSQEAAGRGHPTRNDRQPTRCEMNTLSAISAVSLVGRTLCRGSAARTCIPASVSDDAQSD